MTYGIIQFSGNYIVLRFDEILRRVIIEWNGKYYRLVADSDGYLRLVPMGVDENE
jgi:hypothetical protein